LDNLSRKPLYFPLLKELGHGILGYFGHLQNYLYGEGNQKMVVNLDRKTPKR